MRMRPALLAVVLVVIGGAFSTAAAQGTAPSSGAAPAPPKKSFKDRLYYGGNVGMSFGDVDYFEVTPYAGYDFGHNFSGGVGVFYRHREDNRYDPNLSTSDYGYSVFGRYRPVPPLFLHVEYQWTDFEYLLANGSTDRKGYSAVLLGGGFVQPVGGRAAFVVSALYDINWSEDELTPYDSPWIISAGVSVGF
jgi:hypothetical protein